VFAKVGPLEIADLVALLVPGYLGFVVLQSVNLRAAGHAVEEGVLMTDGETDRPSPASWIVLDGRNSQ
jgi:hypothetical protein